MAGVYYDAGILEWAHIEIKDREKGRGESKKF